MRWGQMPPDQHTAAGTSPEAATVQLTLSGGAGPGTAAAGSGSTARCPGGNTATQTEVLVAAGVEAAAGTDPPAQANPTQTLAAAIPVQAGDRLSCQPTSTVTSRRDSDSADAALHQGAAAGGLTPTCPGNTAAVGAAGRDTAAGRPVRCRVCGRLTTADTPAAGRIVTRLQMAAALMGCGRHAPAARLRRRRMTSGGGVQRTRQSGSRPPTQRFRRRRRSKHETHGWTSAPRSSMPCWHCTARGGASAVAEQSDGGSCQIMICTHLRSCQACLLWW